MNLKEIKKELLKDKEFKEFYENLGLAFEISEMIINLRIKNGLTQKELADKVGTKQSSIARLESGKITPSISFLEKIAKACKTTLISPKFSSLENNGGTELIIFNSIDNNIEYTNSNNYNLMK
jgi:transcriptional regulator with XRE-family HTH domain